MRVFKETLSSGAWSENRRLSRPQDLASQATKPKLPPEAVVGRPSIRT